MRLHTRIGQVAENEMRRYIEARTRLEGLLETNPDVDKDAARARAETLSTRTVVSYPDAVVQVEREILNGATFKEEADG